MSLDPKKFGLTPSLVETVKEALKGDQHKIDANKNNKIDAHDFKLLRKKNDTKLVTKPQYDKTRPAFKEEVEQVDEISDKTLQSYRTKAMAHKASHQPGDTEQQKADRNRKTRNRSQGVRTSWNKMIGRYVKVGGGGKKTYESVEVAEADDAVAKQIAAKKDAMKDQIQRKIAQKQMSAMQAKANKRLSSINASNDKCSCGTTNESKMKCEVHGDKGNGIKGGKEKIEVNPPLREASDLPKKVVTKGHEIAKSLIKHRAKVREPYAVGMATAKKSAGIKEEIDLDEAAITGNEGHGYHGNVQAKDDAERAKKYSAMHTKVKKLAGSAGHLKDARQPNKMVKHFLDSPHGRHVADDPSDRNITSRFGTFKKGYKPHMHEEAEQIDEVSAEVKKNNPLVFGDKKKSNPLVYGDKKRDNPLVHGDKKKSNPLVHREDIQVDELSNKTLQSYKSKSENEIGDAAKKIRGKAKNTVDAKKVYNRIKGIQLASKKLNKKD